MRKLMVVLLVLAMVGGCATLKEACEHGDVIKAKIRATLQIAQVGYPMVAALAGKTTDQSVLYKVALVDAALDLLGQLTYDLLCPGPADLAKADVALNQAQEAKAALRVEVK